MSHGQRHYSGEGLGGRVWGEGVKQGVWGTQTNKGNICNKDKFNNKDKL